MKKAAKTKRETVIRTLIKEFEGKKTGRERYEKREPIKVGKSKDARAEKSVEKSREPKVIVSAHDISFHNRPTSS